MDGSQIAQKLRAKRRKDQELASGRYKAFVVDRMREERDRNRPKGPYGLSVAVREFMLEMQTHRCAICEKPFKGKVRPCTDHCHNSGKVRAFLCSNCNTGLGMYKDRPELLRRAAEYLETHAAFRKAAKQRN